MFVCVSVCLCVNTEERLLHSSIGKIPCTAVPSASSPVPAATGPLHRPRRVPHLADRPQRALLLFSLLQCAEHPSVKRGGNSWASAMCYDHRLDW